MKWFILILVLVVTYAIITGNMGGAHKATENYNKLLSGKPSTQQDKK